MTDQLWCWQVFERGEWGNLAATIPGMSGWNPLVTRSENMAKIFTPLADNHRKHTGRPVRLATYELVATEPLEDG